MTRSFWRFLLSFAVLYVLVLAPWPGWRETYAEYFRALANLVYGHHGGVWTAFLEPCPRTKGFASMDSQIVLYANRAIDEVGNVRASFLGIDSRSAGWLPTGLTLALILSLPLTLKQRIGALFLGLLATQGYALAVIGIYLFNRAPEAGILTVPNWMGSICDALEWTFVTQMGPGFVVPIMIALGASILAGGRDALRSFVLRVSA